MLAISPLQPETWSATTVYLVGAVFVSAIVIQCFNYPITVDVPIVGIGTRYTKWLAAIRNIWYARDAINEGYKKHGDFAFQIPTMTRMDTFICDRQMTREYSAAGDDQLSFRAVMTEEFQFQHLCPAQQENYPRIPNPVIAKALSWQRTRASRPDDAFFQAFSSEFLHGFQEELDGFQQQNGQSFSILSSLFQAKPPDPNSGWLAVPCFPFALRVVARLTTYSLFSEPLCRDAEFLDMCCDFGDALPKDALVLRLWPARAREYVAKFLPAPRLFDKLKLALSGEIASRRNTGSNHMKDILDFIMNWVDQQPAGAYNDQDICNMMVSTIFAAIHTSSQLLVHTIFEIATRPEYVGPLREEVRQCFQQHGQGTKKAIDSMYKVDSFIKETQRLNPLDASSLARLALRDYTFSNGVRIPKGSAIFTPNSPIFQDERFYPDAARFDGYRFSNMRSDPKLRPACDLTSTNEQSMHFGIGRHACPGRFMVSDEVKLAMVHLLLNLDFCIENFGPRPKNVPFGKFMIPNMRAKIWLRESSRSEAKKG